MPTTKPYVLIAEDDYDDVLFFKEAFCACYPDIDIVHFSDAEAVVDFLADCPIGSQPKVILLDYRMPSLDAADILYFLQTKDNYRAISKIVWSASSRQEERQTCEALGAISFFSKPETSEEWNRLVHQIGAYMIS
jgi:CheY-like chemotaxis protein